jgi:hypothetical protein
MKKTTLLMLLLCGMLSIAQNNDEKFTLSINSEPNAWVKDGLNFGLEIEYQMTYLYFKAGTFQFPNLNGIGYAQYHATPLGFNLHSRFKDHRLFTGLVLGFNYREGNPHPIAGVEGGYEYYFGKVGVGLQGSYLRRGDAEFYGGNDWVFNGAVKFIIVL